MNTVSLASELRRLWSERSDDVALVHDEQTVTFGEMERRAENLAGHFRGLGVVPGDRVLCQLPNRPYAVIAIAATWLCGAIHVGIDSTATRAEVSRVVDQLVPRLVVSQHGADLGGPDVLEGATVRAFGSAERSLARAKQHSLSADPPAVIFLSSGTTGHPKFALGFQRNLATRWNGLARWLTFGPGDIHLAQLPLSHGFGLMMSLSALLSGGQLVLVEEFSPAAVLRVVERARVTVLNGTPAHYRLLLREAARSSYDLASLRIGVGSGAAISPKLAADILGQLAIKFVSMYGSSEGVGVATFDRNDILLGSVGRPEGGSVRIVDRDRRILPVGRVGEIAFARRDFPVRYWLTADNAEDADRPPSIEASTSGWYYSRDLGHLDADGRLYVHGRVDRQIDRGGILVDPSEVEDVLLSCAEVSDAVVFGLPDDVLGQRVCAAVVLAGTAGRDQVLHRARAVLSPVKIPHEVYTLSAIPRTPRGKPDLQRLSAVVAELSS